MALSLDDLVYEPRDGSVAGTWTVYFNGYISDRFAGVHFEAGIARGVKGRDFRRLVAAMGPSLLWAQREDARGRIGDAPAVSSPAPEEPAPPAPEELDTPPVPPAPEVALGAEEGPTKTTRKASKKRR